MLKGYDVASWQGNFQYPSDTQFGWVKATEGDQYQDPNFKNDWDELWHRGILRGAYHFAHPGIPADPQINNFLQFVKAHGLNQYDALSLDFEVNDGKSVSFCAAFAAYFVEAVEDATSKNTFVYVNHDYINSGYCAGLLNRPLWIADPSNPAGKPAPVNPWKVWTIHQFDTRPEDQDVFNGDVNTWHTLVNMPPAKPPAKPPADPSDSVLIDPPN